MRPRPAALRAGAAGRAGLGPGAERRPDAIPPAERAIPTASWASCVAPTSTRSRPPTGASPSASIRMARWATSTRFVAVQEAYQLLSDPLRRREWDRRHAAGPLSARDPGTRARPAALPAAASRRGSRTSTARPQPAPGVRSTTWSAGTCPGGRTSSRVPRARQRARTRRRPRPVDDDRPGRRTAIDFDVFSRSSGAAWSMAARRHFRRGDDELPSRGAWRYRGTQVVTGAEARKVAAEEAAERAAPRGRGSQPARHVTTGRRGDPALPHRPQPHRAAARRHGAHGALQLPLRAAAGRHLRPAPRGHRRGALHARRTSGTSSTVSTGWASSGTRDRRWPGLPARGPFGPYRQSERREQLRRGHRAAPGRGPGVPLLLHGRGAGRRPRGAAGGPAGPRRTWAAAPGSATRSAPRAVPRAARRSSASASARAAWSSTTSSAATSASRRAPSAATSSSPARTARRSTTSSSSWTTSPCASATSSGARTTSPTRPSTCSSSAPWAPSPRSSRTCRSSSTRTAPR